MTIDTLAGMMKEGFARIDMRFTGIDKRFDAVDERFTAVDKRFDGIDERITDLTEATGDGFVRLEELIEDTGKHLGRRIDALSLGFGSLNQDGTELKGRVEKLEVHSFGSIQAA